jgi:hypothetical protein
MTTAAASAPALDDPGKLDRPATLEVHDHAQLRPVTGHHATDRHRSRSDPRPPPLPRGRLPHPGVLWLAF